VGCTVSIQKMASIGSALAFFARVCEVIVESSLILRSLRRGSFGVS
jgi:hypothetical protein